MGPHALGPAAYAAKAAALAASDQQAPRCDEVPWSLGHPAADARQALMCLLLLGEDSCGPLRRGQLATGTLALTIHEIQAELSPRDDPDGTVSPRSAMGVVSMRWSQQAVLARGARRESIEGRCAVSSSRQMPWNAEEGCFCVPYYSCRMLLLDSYSTF